MTNVMYTLQQVHAGEPWKLIAAEFRLQYRMFTPNGQMEWQYASDQSLKPIVVKSHSDMGETFSFDFHLKNRGFDKDGKWEARLEVKCPGIDPSFSASKPIMIGLTPLGIFGTPTPRDGT